MNSKMKRRMIVVGGIIVIAIILLLAFVGAGNNAKVVSVSDVSDGSYSGKKVQVTGSVVDNSYSVDADGVLTFLICEEGGDSESGSLAVSYDKGVSATFGNGVTAICTGRMNPDGSLTCTELVTKCPSKYENASSALSVSQLLSYDADAMIGNTVKVTGTVAGVGDVTQDVRLVVKDADTEEELSVQFGGALPDEVSEGASIVVTGSLIDDQGSFLASEVALEG